MNYPSENPPAVAIVDFTERFTTWFIVIYNWFYKVLLNNFILKYANENEKVTEAMKQTFMFGGYSISNGENEDKFCANIPLLGKDLCETGNSFLCEK